MTEALAQAGTWLVQQAIVFPDTIVTRQAPAGGFERAVTVAQGLVSLALLAVLIAVFPLALRLHRSVERANALLDRMQREAGPLIARSTQIADDVQHVTATIRGDIHRVSDTIGEANDRVRQAVRMTERRLRDFNALLRTIQREAEQLFVGAASAVRGARFGAGSFRRGPELASLDDLDDEDADLLDELDYEYEEVIDADDDVFDAPEGETRKNGPRIRRRR